MNKTLFITAFHSFISKNILNSGVLSRILENSELKVVLLVPENKKDFFEKTYKSEKIKVEGIPVSKLANYPKVKFFSYLSKLLIDSHYLWYKKIEKKDQQDNLKSKIICWLEIAFTAFFSKLPKVTTPFRFLFKNSIKIGEIRQLFKQYDEVFLFATDIFDESDVLCVNEAKKLKIPVLGMVRSWDNCYSKGLLRAAPDHFMVNNPTIKEELTELHGISPEKIKIVGVPQYDHFLNEDRIDRNKFMEKVGLSLNKKTILFAPAGTILSDKDSEICGILIEAVNKNKFKYPSQILVRNHPNHPADLTKFADTDFVKVEYPGKVFGKNPKETELTLDDSRHLADSLYHCDIVIYTATTLGIDSLCFDKPQIIINFDGYENKPYKQSVKRYYNEDHMKKMIACGGVAMANSPDELIEEINKYFENPKFRFEGRERAREQQIHFLDGKSNQRVAKEILDFVSH